MCIPVCGVCCSSFLRAWRSRGAKVWRNYYRGRRQHCSRCVRVVVELVTGHLLCAQILANRAYWHIKTTELISQFGKKLTYLGAVCEMYNISTHVASLRLRWEHLAVDGIHVRGGALCLKPEPSHMTPVHD